jgi:hypothetical protein
MCFACVPVDVYMFPTVSHLLSFVFLTVKPVARYVQVRKRRLMFAFVPLSFVFITVKPVARHVQVRKRRLMFAFVPLSFVFLTVTPVARYVQVRKRRLMFAFVPFYIFMCPFILR